VGTKFLLLRKREGGRGSNSEIGSEDRFMEIDRLCPGWFYKWKSVAGKARLDRPGTKERPILIVLSLMFMPGISMVEMTTWKFLTST
jgi:hypothetical protein